LGFGDPKLTNSLEDDGDKGDINILWNDKTMFTKQGGSMSQMSMPWWFVINLYLNFSLISIHS
jgi:hypothetical protein